MKGLWMVMGWGQPLTWFSNTQDLVPNPQNCSTLCRLQETQKLPQPKHITVTYESLCSNRSSSGLVERCILQYWNSWSSLHPICPIYALCSWSTPSALQTLLDTGSGGNHKFLRKQTKEARTQSHFHTAVGNSGTRLLLLRRDIVVGLSSQRKAGYRRKCLCISLDSP